MQDQSNMAGAAAERGLKTFIQVVVKARLSS